MWKHDNRQQFFFYFIGELENLHYGNLFFKEIETIDLSQFLKNKSNYAYVLLNKIIYWNSKDIIIFISSLVS